MSIKVKVAQAHLAQLADIEIRREYESVNEEINKVSIDYVEDAVNFVFVKGMYSHAQRKMITACLFVNKLNKPIKELHGEVRLKFMEKTALIAKTTINFDETFMGELGTDEALLVHLGIPVKGLDVDETFSKKDIYGSFDNVKVTPIVTWNA